MARRTKEDAQKTREMLLDAAEQVFYEKGVSRTSLNDIAQAAGVTRGAIYWHFKNKHDVFEAMMERQEMPLEMLRAVVEDPDQPDPLGRFRDFMLHLTREIARDPQRRRVFEIMFHKCELTEENEPLVTRHRNNIKDATERMRGVLRNAIRLEQLPESLDVERAIIQLHVQITGLIYFWLLVPDTFDMEKESERVINAYFYSLEHCFVGEDAACGAG
ncbi:TetR family transcriptional regulator [Marinobacter sp. JSM 1782161]|uniref:TetR family transcriptional regulator n=1 Tax=Marinobacter sp. JSM 1782161 TaxID=2685906 RepID=UPI001402C634|nr:TetR family transcriptional regulator [Marinobacter sp. JSM 1782161]